MWKECRLLGSSVPWSPSSREVGWSGFGGDSRRPCKCRWGAGGQQQVVEGCIEGLEARGAEALRGWDAWSPEQAITRPRWPGCRGTVVWPRGSGRLLPWRETWPAFPPVVGIARSLLLLLNIMLCKGDMLKGIRGHEALYSRLCLDS